MSTPLAYDNGRLVPANALSIPIYDAGFVLGVTVAEQVRTFGGRLFRFSDHLQRLAQSLRIVGCGEGLDLEALAMRAEELVRHNHAFLPAGRDLGLAILASPGHYTALAEIIPPEVESGVTIRMHTYPLSFGQWAAKYTAGQSLVVVSTRQVPPQCWPSELKCRSRMHYYLADNEARRIQAGSRALLLDQEERVTEASTANVLIYREGEGLISPPAERILPGISVAVTLELARQLGIPTEYRDLSVSDVEGANEIMLCSTSVCMLPVTEFNQRPVNAGRPGPIYGRLLGAWSDLVGLDVAEQARRDARFVVRRLTASQRNSPPTESADSSGAPVKR